MSSSSIVRAVILFDPSREDLTDSKLVYYYGGSLDESERRNESNLIQGVVDFAFFCSNGSSDMSDPVTIETEYLIFLVNVLEASLRICLVFLNKDRISLSSGKSIMNKFITTYFLLHGSISDQSSKGIPLSSSMDDFVPAFVAAESSRSKSIESAIRYAPVDRHAFLAVHSLGLEILDEFKNQISHFAFLFKGFLISTSLEPDLLAPLYAYLVMDSCNGSVSNTKLLKSPYGRISTPAVVPGGGSSSFGRCNVFDSENSSHGFLFGPTGGGGAGVFCPLVYLQNNTKRYLCVYLINSFMVVLLLQSISDFELFKRIENVFTDNHVFDDEIVPLVRSDFAKSITDLANPSFEFTYRNLINKSLIISDNCMNGGDRKRSLLSRTFLYPFSDRNVSKSPDMHGYEDPLRYKIFELAKNFDRISNISVKKSSSEGWRIFTRRGPFREVEFFFRDPKTPLWKVNAEIENVFRHKFDSIFL